MSKVVVIGAGVIGLSCAYELVRLGVDVTVLGQRAAWRRRCLGECRMDHTDALRSPPSARAGRNISQMDAARGQSSLYQAMGGFRTSEVAVEFLATLQPA